MPVTMPPALTETPDITDPASAQSRPPFETVTVEAEPPFLISAFAALAMFIVDTLPAMDADPPRRMFSVFAEPPCMTVALAPLETRAEMSMPLSPTATIAPLLAVTPFASPLELM